MKRAWLTAALCLGIAAGGHTHSGDWYLVEFAANRPACEMPDTANGQDTVQRAHTTGQRTDPMPSTARCRETASRRSALELKDGEVIEMPATTDIPSAWVALRQLWLYAPAVGSDGFRMSLQRTPGGVRLQLQEGSVRYLETLPLDTWVRLDRVNARQLWARVRQSPVQ